MRQKIATFWSQSYHSDPRAFGFELTSFVVTVAASLYLAVNARDPNMLAVYPGFLVGSVSQCYASYRRGAAWVMLLTFYFSVVNIFGFGVAINWW
ncbi:MAG: hypothetical protein EB168_02670 [Euryarchaeota archaeon]|nr:hypothetical protein [Euryarchaeota archaeon]